VLEYLRDGVLSVSEQDAADLDVSVLRWLKREMGIYCIEVIGEPQEVAFAIGSDDDDNRPFASVERYDVASGAWREAAPMATARDAFGLYELNGELYVTGGLSAPGAPTATVERYDSRLDIWSAAPALPYPRFGHCACAVGDTMYVLGGIEVIDGRGRTVSSMLKFGSRAQTWSEVAPMPAGRDYAGVCVVRSAIYIFGGRDGIRGATSTTYRFSTETNTWTILSSMPVTKYAHSVCVLDGLIYVMRGQDDAQIFSCVHCYDPVADSWSEVAPMSAARAEHGVFVLNGSIYVVGGHEREIAMTSMEQYCVALDSWSDVRGGELSTARVALGSLSMWVEVDLFDSLMAKAKRARR
jgi:hypothetical protein